MSSPFRTPAAILAEWRVALGAADRAAAAGTRKRLSDRAEELRREYQLAARAWADADSTDTIGDVVDAEPADRERGPGARDKIAS
jgi:hypothetical protein